MLQPLGQYLPATASSTQDRHTQGHDTHHLKPPNTRRQARLAAGAERTLAAVACTPLFGHDLGRERRSRMGYSPFVFPPYDMPTEEHNPLVQRRRV